MSQTSTNPLLHEYALVEELKLSPDLLEDQTIELPSFKNVVKWILGKPLTILTRRGLDAKKIDLWLALIDQKRTLEQQKEQEVEKDFKGAFS